MPTPRAGQRQQLGTLLGSIRNLASPAATDHTTALRTSSAPPPPPHHAASLATLATDTHPEPTPLQPSHHFHINWWYSFAAAPLAAAAAWALSTHSSSSAESKEQALASQAQAQAKAGGFGKLFSLHTRQRVFFNYEKRIRDMSSLDKVFNYFSSEERQHARFMLPGDLLNAIVATYPASRSGEERAGALAGEPRQHSHVSLKHADRRNQFFSRFDLDGDGLLALAEFQLVVTLLSIPEEDVELVFDAMDLDGSGLIDAAEFQTIMRQLQGRAGINSCSQSMKKMEAKENSSPPCGLLVSFFGPDQRSRLELEKFKSFCAALRRELLKLEFLHYQPDEHKMIPGVDFARSLVVAADMGNVDAHLNQVEAHAAQLSNMSISFAEFEAVHEVQKRMYRVKMAMEYMSQMGRRITKQELDRIIHRFTGVSLSDQVLEVMMITFDDGRGQGSLDRQRFTEALRRKGQFWARRVSA